jgi:hypothetical protein
VHITYSLTSSVSPPVSQNLFGDNKATTTFTSKVVLWNKHSWAVGGVVVKDMVPLCEEPPSVSALYGEKVLLRKPEGLADVGEGVEVKAGVEVLKAEEREYVKVEDKDKGDKGKEKKGKKKVKVMWEKPVAELKGGEEGRFEWRCGEIEPDEKVVLEAQWEVKGAPYARWHEVRA